MQGLGHGIACDAGSHGGARVGIVEVVVAVVPPLKTTGDGRAEAVANDEGGHHPAGLRGPDTGHAAADLAY